jgi:3-ketosteroid 9alpha-monooxygenase subunit B
MSVMQKLRAYHAVLGVLVVFAYLTGEAGLIHLVLGYAVAGVVVGRIMAAFSGMPQLGLSRFHPHFEGLTLNTAATHPAISRTLLAGIAAALIAATVTGIQLERSQAPRQAASAVVAPAFIAPAAIAPAAIAPAFIAPAFISPALADSDRERTARAPGERRGESGRSEGGSDELHEFFSNLLMLLVGLHVAYLLLFKRSLARFMLFLAPPRAPVVLPPRAGQ